MAPKHNIVQMNRGTREKGLENCWQEIAAEYVLRIFLLQEDQLQPMATRE
jgi:hypothetical protein